MDKKSLIKLANMTMPYGKYAGRLLMDIPEEYLLWMANSKDGFPDSELGILLAFCLEIKREGLVDLLKPLKNYPTVH